MGVGRRPAWLALAACLAATATAGDAWAQASGTAAREPADAAGADSLLGGLRLKGWATAPIAWVGSVSYDGRLSSGRGEPRTVAHLMTGSLSARSYIYQPWFATVDGTLRLTRAWTIITNPADAVGPGLMFGSERYSTIEHLATGSLRVDVFPRSRFPFEVHFSQNDSRVDNSLFSTVDFTTRNFGFSQRYRPMIGAYNLRGSYDYREQRTASARDTQHSLEGDFDTRWKDNQLAVTLALSHARRGASGESSDFRSFVGRHHYRPAAAFSIDTTVNGTHTKEDLFNASTDVKALQVSSVGLWHEEGSKLTMTGSALGLILRNDVSGQEIDNFGLSIGSSYQVSSQVSLTANGSAGFTRSSFGNSQNGTGSASASWQGKSVEFLGVRYDPYAGVSASGNVVNTELDGTQTQANFSAQAGHTLTRTWPLGTSAGLTLTASQSLSHSLSDGDATRARIARQSLRQGASASLNIAGDGKNAFTRVSITESRDLGDIQSKFRLANFQISGSLDIDRNRSFSGDLTVQWTQQQSPEGLAFSSGGVYGLQRTASTSAGGEISYRHNRLFGVPGLRFTSRLRLAQDVLKQPGAFVSIPDHESRLWENQLDWSIGRLQTGLTLRIAEVDGKVREYLTWRLVRSLGD